MAGCDVLYYDPAHAGPEDGWRPCPAAGQVWTDPGQVLRFVCASTAANWSPCMPPAWPTASAGAAPGCRSATARPRRGERPWTCASSTAPARPAAPLRPA